MNSLQKNLTLILATSMVSSNIPIYALETESVIDKQYTVADEIDWTNLINTVNYETVITILSAENFEEDELVKNIISRNEHTFVIDYLEEINSFDISIEVINPDDITSIMVYYEMIDDSGEVVSDNSIFISSDKVDLGSKIECSLPAKNIDSMSSINIL